MYRKTSAAEEYIRLRKSHKKLLNSLDVKADFLSSLYEEGVIDEDDVERISAKETSKDKADVLLLMIQKKCVSGGRPYARFLAALEECDQGHLSTLVKGRSVKDKDYEAYKTSFMPQSGTSSTAPGSPRRSYNQPPSVSSETKMIEEHVNNLLSQPHSQDKGTNTHLPVVNFHGPPTVQSTNTQDGYGANSSVQPGYGNITYHYETNQFSYGTHIGTSTENAIGYSGHHSNNQRATDGNNTPEDTTSPTTNYNALLRRKKPKNIPYYEPSNRKSPHCKIFKIANNRNNPSDSSAPQRFDWKCSNPELLNENYRYSTGLHFSILPEDPRDPVYQSLQSVCSFVEPNSAAGKQRSHNPNRDSRMTDKEEHLEVHEEEIEDVYNEPTNQAAGAVLQVADYTQSLNDITHVGTRGNLQEHHVSGSNFCVSCQRILAMNNNTVNTSVLTPRSESDAQSIYILNVSRDQILANSNPRNNVCCILL